MCDQCGVKKQKTSAETGLDLSQYSPSDWQFWQCLICHQVVVDAVHLRCCGGLFCQSCVLTWLRLQTTCPNCRNPGTHHQDVVKDVRSERHAADVMRPCALAHLGCEFKGNRKAATDHASICGFVSREMLELEILRLKELLDCSHQRVFALFDAALGPNPAVDAMKVMHKLERGDAVIQIKRTKRPSIDCCALRSVGADIVILELRQGQTVGMHLRFANNARPHVPAIELSILHPREPLCSRRVTFVEDGPENGQPTQAITAENIMTSEAFDGYCVRGFFFVSIAGNMIPAEE